MHLAGQESLTPVNWKYGRGKTELSCSFTPGTGFYHCFPALHCDHLPSFLWLSWLSKRGKRTERVSSEHLPSRWPGEQSSATKHIVVLSNFPFPLLTVYQGGASPIPATFSSTNYNHLGVFLPQNQGKKNLQRPVWMTFCRTFLSPFSLKQGRICQSSY